MTSRSPSNMGSLAARLAPGLFFLWLAACDSTTSVPNSPNSPMDVAYDSTPPVQDSLQLCNDSAANAGRLALDSILPYLGMSGQAQVQEIVSHLDLRMNFKFTSIRGDTTLLEDCVTRLRCSDSTAGELTTIEYSDRETHRSAVFPSSSALDSVLDPSVDSSRRATLAGSLSSHLLRSTYDYYASHTTSEGRFYKRLFERVQSSGAVVTNHTLVSGALGVRDSSSIRIRSNPGMPDAWLHGSQNTVSNNSDGLYGGRSSLEWDASDSGLTMIGGCLNGVATVKWWTRNGDSIQGTIRSKEGGSFVTEFRARNVGGYESLQFESPGLVAIYRSERTILVGWHDAELRSTPDFDSVSLRFPRLEPLWKDANLSLRWDKPTHYPFDGRVTHVRLEGTEADGTLRTIVGDVVLSTSVVPTTWNSCSSSSSR